MFWTPYPRDAVQVAGPDAATFLHSQLSQEIRPLSVGESAWSFLLQPTGKIEVLLRIRRIADDSFTLDTDAGFGEAMVARLNRFKIRVKAEVSELPWRCIALRGDGAATQVGTDVVSSWGDGVDLVSEAPSAPAGAKAGSADDLLSARIDAMWPAMGSEIIPGETIPGETGVVAVAVNFTKGCYPGQELVERMDSRGAAPPKSLQRVTVPPGTAVGDAYTIDGQSVGVVTSVHGEVAARDGEAQRGCALMAFTKAQLAKNLDRLRGISLALPEATEELTWGTDINFRVRKKIFCFPGQGGSIMVKCDREELPALLGDSRCRPAPYLARGGWIVMELVAPIDWTEVSELIATSYCLIAPKSLAAKVAAD